MHGFSRQGVGGHDRRRWLVMLLCWAMVVPAASQESVTHRVRDPIFNGQAQVYLAGPENAPVVVLIHGIGDKGARDWDGLIPRLAGDFRVLAVDLPGFGRSSKSNAAYTPDNYVAFLRHLIGEQVKTRPFMLVGHSMGGALALRYAARYPRDVAALVVADVPAILHRLAYSQHLSHLGIDFLPSLYPAQNDHLNNLASTILGAVEKAQPTPEAIVASATLRKSLLSADPAKIAGMALAIEDFSFDIANVQAPTLVLWGGRDRIAPLRNARVLSASLPNAELEIFESSGHTPMDDVPEAFGARVLEFLREPVIVHRKAFPDAVHAPQTGRTGRCHKRRGMVFEGDYDRIEIVRCRDVLIRNARVREAHIANAAVNIEDSIIGGVHDGGLIVSDARVWVTSSAIEADTAIRLDEAHLNIAGVRIRGSDRAIAAERKSEVVCSLCRIESPHFRGGLHGLRVVLPGEPL